MDSLGPWVVVIWIILNLGLVVFLISLLWRITVALERISRHLLEIARDVKELAHNSGDGKE